MGGQITCSRCSTNLLGPWAPRCPFCDGGLLLSWMAASIQVHVPSHVHAYSQRAVRLHRIRASVHLTSAVRPFLVCVAEGDVPALVDVLGVVAALLSFSINTLCILPK